MGAELKPASTATPLLTCPALAGDRVELWVKNDGASHAVYGGNKARKAERLIEEAVRRGADRVLTCGAAGSHHVLSTALFARQRGLRAAAVLTPTPGGEHAERTLRAALAQGLEAVAAPSPAAVPWALLHALRATDYCVPPGGSNAIGAGAYVDAVAELALQVRSGELPEPDLIVVALGSGGTSAGLLAGLVRHGLRARLLGVRVAPHPLARRFVLWLAQRAFEGSAGATPAPLAELERRLELDAEYAGPGYGLPTPEADAAAELARHELGLELDASYTAKAFARALTLLRRWRDDRAFTPEHGRRVVLYWHTLSAAPLEPLLEGAPALPRALHRLLRAPAAR